MRQEFENTNILIVEDDFTSYLLMMEYLIPHQFTFYRAVNDVETWELLNSKLEFHLILMDVKLPTSSMNGIDLSRGIKKRFPNVPIMIQTAVVESKNQFDFIVGVYDDFITKPYYLDCFTDKVLSLLNCVAVSAPILD